MIKSEKNTGLQPKRKITRELSAGGVVFKKAGKETLWLVTQSAPSRLYPNSVWRLPKGWLDDKNKGREPGILASGRKKAEEEEIQAAAIREVAEESGIKAKIIAKLGTEKYFFTRNGKRILKLVTFYLMEWVSDYRQGWGKETMAVKWLPYFKAEKILSYGGEKKILLEAKKILESRK